MSKIKTFEEIERIARDLKKDKKKIATTNGVFDILHLGHVRYLEEAKRMGDVLIVGINSDASVRKLKGKNRPINSENDRTEVLAALEVVDYIVIFKEDNPIKLLSLIEPDVHVKGGDYKIGKIVEKNIVEKNKGRVVLVQEEKGFSTTSLIKRILTTYAK